MLNNCNYTKVKLLHELSRISIKIKDFSCNAADEAGHTLCRKEYEDLEKDLEKHIEHLRMAVEGLSKEGKFN